MPWRCRGSMSMMTIAALAAQFGVAPQTVHNWLVAAGVSRRPSPATVRQDISDD
jgi:transposase-like protein